MADVPANRSKVLDIADLPEHSADEPIVAGRGSAVDVFGLGYAWRVSKSNLSRDEAAERARLIVEPEYEVQLDLLREDDFTATSRIRFGCPQPGAQTFVDLAGARVRS